MCIHLGIRAPWASPGIITWGGSARLFYFFFCRRTGPKRSGAVLACFWTKFQAKPSILDPIRVIFDDLGPNRHFGRDLDLQDQARDWPGGPGPAHICSHKTKTVFFFGGGRLPPSAQQEKAGLFYSAVVRFKIGISGGASQVLSFFYPVPGLVPLKYFPPGGHDSGRLGLSVRTWLAEAATAADSLGGGGDAPQEKKFKLFLGLLGRD